MLQKQPSRRLLSVQRIPDRFMSSTSPSSNGSTDPTESASTESAPTPADPAASEAPEGSSAAAGPMGPDDERCQNCGARLDGPYCAECGQRAAERIVPVWHMLNEFLEILFDLDLRIVRTLPKFLFQPGRLTKEYINGRRRQYVRPLRLYLFSSFLLFGVLALTTIDFGRFAFAPNQEAMEEARRELDVLRDSTGTTAATIETMRRQMQASGMDSTDIREAETAVQNALGQDLGRLSASVPSMTAATTSSSTRSEVLSYLLSDSLALGLQVTTDSTTNSQIEQMLRLKAARVVNDPQQLVGTMIDIGPYLMFVLLPVFALLLKLLYVRQGRLYAEHIIFTLHMHALAFVAFALSTLLDTAHVAQLNDLSTWVAVSPFVYVVVAMWRVYDQGLPTTVAKSFLLFLTYSIILVVGLVLLAIAAVALM